MHSDGELSPPLLAPVPPSSWPYRIHPFAASLPLLLSRRSMPSPSLFHKQLILFPQQQDQGLCCCLRGEPAQDGVAEGILSWVTSSEVLGSLGAAGRVAAPRGGGHRQRGGPRGSYAEQMAALLSCRGAGGWEQPRRKLCSDIEQCSCRKLVGKVLWFALVLHGTVGSASHFPLKVINLRNPAVALTLLWKGQSKYQVNVILCFTVSIPVIQKIQNVVHRLLFKNINKTPHSGFRF